MNSVLYFQYNDKQKKSCYSDKVRKADLEVQRKEDTQMTMTNFAWQSNYDVNNGLNDNVKALNFEQGLRFAYTFSTKRRKKKL